MGWLPDGSVSLTDAALAYASHGFRVIPVWGLRDVDGARTCACGRPSCSAPGKHPIGGEWQKKATSDVDAVRDARRAHPAANVGLAMGGELRLVAVDIDGPTGRASWRALEQQHGIAPPTLTSSTGRVDGGEHRIYRLPAHLDAKRLGNRAGFRWPGIDTRVEGGQIVVAPSMHASGRRYAWIGEATEVATMPDALFHALADGGSTPELPPAAGGAPPKPPAPAPRSSGRASNNRPFLDRVVKRACERIAGAAEGGRNQLLFAKATTVLEYHLGEGVDPSSARASLEAAGRACGLGADECRETVEKAWKRAQGTPRKIPASRKPDAPKASASTGSAEPWEHELATDKQGQIKNTFRNVVLILRESPWMRGRLSYNRMRVIPYLDGVPLEDSDIAMLREGIEARWTIAPAREVITSAVGLVSKEHPFHPVQDYLHELEWDETPRLELVAQEVFGLTADALTNRMVRCWFVSAIARALTPGCKVDSSLVLVGDQGIRKSTFFRVLAGEWFSDTYTDIKSRDGILGIHAAWICEWGEIESVTGKNSSADVKRFMSSARDHVRPPYGTGVLDLPRSGVIVGSTNRAFLDDETGARRFWPVRVERVNVAWVEEHRDQLWAEAVELYEAGEVWWLTPEEERAREERSDEHTVENPWLERIATWLDSPSRRIIGSATVAEVLVGALGIDIGKVNHSDEIRVGKALKTLGWIAGREKRNGAKVRVYKPDTRDRVDHSVPLGPGHSVHSINQSIQSVKSIEEDRDRGDRVTPNKTRELEGAPEGVVNRDGPSVPRSPGLPDDEQLFGDWVDENVALKAHEKPD